MRDGVGRHHDGAEVDRVEDGLLDAKNRLRRYAKFTFVVEQLFDPIKGRIVVATVEADNAGLCAHEHRTTNRGDSGACTRIDTLCDVESGAKNDAVILTESTGIDRVLGDLAALQACFLDVEPVAGRGGVRTQICYLVGMQVADILFLATNHDRPNGAGGGGGGLREFLGVIEVDKLELIARSKGGVSRGRGGVARDATA